MANLFNPSIWEQGTFNESTKTLVTGQYGFGGWWYSSGVDLSQYRFLVARLGAPNTRAVSFRIFDENNYWSKPAMYDFGSSQEVVVKLSDMYKDGTTTKLNPKHIYIVGFWSLGNGPIVIEDVFLSNSSEFGPVDDDDDIPTSIKDPHKNYKLSPVVDVYTILGVKIRSQVKREEAVMGLPTGMYIVERKKVFVLRD